MSELLQPSLLGQVDLVPATAVAEPRRSQSAMRLAAHYAAFADQSDDLQTVQQEVCRVAAEGLEADSAGLFVYDADSKDFLLLAGAQWQPAVGGRSRLEANIGTNTGIMWHNGQSGIYSTIGNNKHFQALDLPVERCLAKTINVLVLGEGQLAAGILEVTKLKGDKLTADDMYFLQLLSYSLAAAWVRLVRHSFREEQIAGIADEHQMSLRKMQSRVCNDL